MKKKANPSFIVLSREDLAALAPFGDYVAAVADAFRMLSEGRAILPPSLHVADERGGFHVKAGYLPTGPGYAAFKVNANYPDNPTTNGLPTIQGAILLFDASIGAPVALLDSIEITVKRTGAATAVAARYLARPQSRVVAIFGCGVQARIQLLALRHVLDIRKVYLIDRNAEAAASFATEIAQQGLDAEIPVDRRKATLTSDVIVTCTPARSPFLDLADVSPGTFIAAIGADNPDKSEIEPALMARGRVVTDLTEQCSYMGDLNHAIRGGAMAVTDVHAQLGELVSGAKSGRCMADDITIFDGTGLGIQDAAACVRAYRLARERRVGYRMKLN